MADQGLHEEEIAVSGNAEYGINSVIRQSPFDCFKDLHEMVFGRWSKWWSLVGRSARRAVRERRRVRVCLSRAASRDYLRFDLGEREEVGGWHWVAVQPRRIAVADLAHGARWEVF